MIRNRDRKFKERKRQDKGKRRTKIKETVQSPKERWAGEEKKIKVVKKIKEDPY